MTALSRLLPRLLLAAALLLLAGLLPAATLLLTPGADCPAAVGSASAGSGCSCTSPACWFPQTALLLTRGTAESCDAKRPIAPISAQLSPRTESGFTPACKHDRGRRARDRWARRAPFRPRRKIHCGSRPI